MKYHEISDYLENAKKTFENLNCVKGVQIVDNSLLVSYKEKVLNTGWEKVLKTAKPFTKLHYIVTVYENTPEKAKFLKADALFVFKNKCRSLYFYKKNKL